MKDALIDWQSVAVHAHGRDWFDGLTWRLLPGELWNVIGSNGSGKTLLANALARRHRVLGQAFRSPDLAPRDVSVLAFETQRTHWQGQGGYRQARWQSFEKDGVPTVADQLSRQAVEARNRYEVVPPEDDDFRERRTRVVDQLGLAPLLDRLTISLSNGETRKLMLAQALLRRPKLLIVEDPFTGLDPEARRRFIEALPHWLASGMTIVLMSREPIELPYAMQRLELPPPPHEDMKTDQGLPEPRTAPEIFLQLEHVSVSYGEARLLDDISWTIRRGENWLVSGENGAGKSTLISLLTGDHPQAYANRIHIMGQRFGRGESIWWVKQQVGLVAPESQAHFPGGWTVRQAVGSGFQSTMGLYQRLTEEEEAATDAWIRRLGLAASAERRFGTLSAGQQRVALLARALVHNPPLLLLDEPFQGLDPSRQGELARLLVELGGQSGRSMVVVTHEPERLPEMSWHRLHLVAGRLSPKP